MTADKDKEREKERDRDRDRDRDKREGGGGGGGGGKGRRGWFVLHCRVQCSCCIMVDLFYGSIGCRLGFRAVSGRF